MFRSLRVGKIGVRLAVALCVTAAVAVAATTVANLWVAKGLSDQAFEQKLSALQIQLTDAIKAESDRALSMAATVADTSAVQESFAKQDRDALAAQFVPQFEKMKSEQGVEQFQFHLPPAISFLRVHKPGKFGDDLSSFRHTVVEVNSTGKPISGLEYGVAGLGIRGVVPVFYEGKGIGSLEIGLTFGQGFFDSFTARTSAYAALYLFEETKIATFATTYPESSKFEEGLLRDAAKEPVTIPVMEIDGTANATLLTPISDFSGKTIGVAAVSFDRTPIDAALASGRNLSLAIGAAALVASLLIAWAMNASIARPIGAITAIMRRLASGDTSVDIPGTRRSDELGDMAQAVQVFKDNAIEKQKLEAEQRAAEIRAAEERKLTLSRLADNFEASVGRIAQNVSENVANLDHTATAMAQIAQRTGDRTNDVRSTCVDASNNVQAVAAAVDELSSSIAEISQQVARSRDVSRQAIEEAANTDSTVKRMTEAAAKIGDVVKLIQDIAGQTNLLALNATIEAARAGEAGRGFAIVANEVKNLATQTAKATEGIVDQIGTMQAATQNTVEAVDAISRRIAQIGEVSISIAAAIDEQTAATQAIARNTRDTAKGTEAVSEGIESVRKDAGESSQAVQHAAAAIVELNKQTVQLQSEMSSFLKIVRAP